MLYHNSILFLDHDKKDSIVIVYYIKNKKTH